MGQNKLGTFECFDLQKENILGIINNLNTDITIPFKKI